MLSFLYTKQQLYHQCLYLTFKGSGDSIFQFKLYYDYFRPHSKTDILWLHFSSLNKADSLASEASACLCK